MAAAAQTFRVTTASGESIDVRANWAFDNEGTLVLRIKGEDKSDVVATFAPGSWASFVRTDALALLPAPKGDA